MKKMGFNKGQFQIIGAEPKKTSVKNREESSFDPFMIKKDILNQPMKNDFNKNLGSKDKTVVSRSTNTKTRTCNGVKTKTVTTKLKYSDGSEEQIVEETTEQVC
jgi:hypothetical protein